ncbi:MAG TPA: type VI secretion system tube protein Hcp [Pyrinomonadaceae bacterium]
MAVDQFLKIDGVPGESKDSKHKDEIDVLSWSWGASQMGTFGAMGGGGAGKVNIQDFSFSMPQSKATPKLLQMCATGEHIKKAVLTVRKAGKEQQEYLKYSFYDLLVSSVQSGGHNEVTPDSISLNFAKIEIDYKEQKEDGTLGSSTMFKYDQKQNKAY